MLYLAEIQRKSGFIGSGKAEFKLLACQRSEHEWSSVPGDEIVSAPDDASYGDGRLVMVDLNSSRQVQRHQEASLKLVNILQNFSSLSKKFKSQGEEIEQWKESLTYQSQALNRREAEIESRQEQIEQAEADLEQVESQKRAVETQQKAVDELREELSRKNAELEGAWAHLNGEMQRFEERQGEAKGGLSEEQSRMLRESLSQLVAETSTAEEVEGYVSTAFSMIEQYRHEVAENQQILTEKQGEMERSKETLVERSEVLERTQRSLYETEATLCSTQSHLLQKQAILGAKQEENQLLTEQLKNQTNLHQKVYELLNAADKVKLSKKVDVAVLEAMAEDELQSLVARLELDLDKMSRFVADQEEELRLQQEDIDTIQSRMESASEYDRLQLETEMADEKEKHVMLNRTLVGQRRNLLEREEVLGQHRAVLLRRQGLSAEGTGAAAELEPVLDEIDALRARLGEQIQQVEAEIAQIQGEIDELKQTKQQQQSEIDACKQAVEDAAASCQTQQEIVGFSLGQIELYELLLPSIEERLNSFYQSLETVGGFVDRIRVAEAQRHETIASACQAIQSAEMQAPALV